MPVPSVHRVAGRYLLASALDQAGRDVAKGLVKLIREADIPVEARRFTKHFRELETAGSTGWIRPKRFDDVIFHSSPAQNFMLSGTTEDDRFERRQQVEEVANTVLLKAGIIGRRAK